MAETTTDVERDTVFLPELELQHPLPSFGGLEESESEPPLPWADWLDGVPTMNTNEHGILTASPDVSRNPIALPQTPATPLSFPQHQPQAADQPPAVPTFQPWPSLMGLGYDAASLAPIPPMASYKFEESVSYRTVNGGQHAISVVESFEAPASYAQSSEENHKQS
ncbi:hypothetical protein EIK77_002371 [Talaromyces pinophilus]|nr:hypothetical protein EIK77_002371 [Talaromyces pinophilus]